ncbi:MAG: type II toxin-antitoxin system ParD family antitoxin [Beijerinckiaceae bacterium]|nr:type II toxin-antitoxin system ParD family antitoxin [Beijerinckiaceae bacterium]
MNAEKMSITLPADMAQRIRSRVESGTYSSNSEVIREAMRLLEDREHEREQRLAVIRAKIKEAEDHPVLLTANEVDRHFEQRFTGARKTGSQ